MSADPVDSLLADPAVAIGTPRLLRSPRRLAPDVYERDSLPAGAVVLSIRHVFRDPLRDTVLVRAGYTDTLVAGLARSCQPAA